MNHNRRLPGILLAGAVLLVGLLGAVFAQSAAAVWNFDRLSPGPPGSDFAAGPGEWRIVEHASAPSPGNVMAQMARNESRVFNVLLVRESRYRDLDLSVRMQAMDGATDQGGGLVWRAKDARNYYVARYNPLEDNFRVYKVVDGRRTQLQSADIPRSEGWHQLRVVMRGDGIECYYDGRKYLQAQDSTFSGAGQIGLWTKADARTLFDDLAVAPSN